MLTSVSLTVVMAKNANHRSVLSDVPSQTQKK
jgi:hypothetical protein